MLALYGSDDILRIKIAMPQAMRVGTQCGQQGLAPSHVERATVRTSRELALPGREHSFDQGAAPVELSRKRPPHCSPHSACPLGFFPRRSRDHTPGFPLLASISEIPVAVELGTGRHQSDTHLRRQIHAVVQRAASRAVREHKLLVYMCHDHPFQPMPSGERILLVVMQAAHEKRADCSLRQASSILTGVTLGTDYSATPSRLHYVDTEHGKPFIVRAGNLVLPALTDAHPCWARHLLRCSLKGCFGPGPNRT